MVLLYKTRKKAYLFYILLRSLICLAIYFINRVWGWKREGQFIIDNFYHYIWVWLLVFLWVASSKAGISDGIANDMVSSREDHLLVPTLTHPSLEENFPCCWMSWVGQLHASFLQFSSVNSCSALVWQRKWERWVIHKQMRINVSFV